MKTTSKASVGHAPHTLFLFFNYFAVYFYNPYREECVATPGITGNVTHSEQITVLANTNSAPIVRSSTDKINC